MEEGKVTHPDRGSPQGGVISPMLSNIFLHEVDRQWCRSDGVAIGDVRLVRYADDMVLLARTEQQAREAWEQLQAQFAALRLVVNQEKSRLTTLAGRIRVPGLRVSESSGADAVDVATREGVPQYPPAGSRSGAIVSVERAGRRGDPEAEPDPEWVVYLFPGRQQQPDIP